MKLSSRATGLRDFATLVLLLIGSSLPAGDCNQNGVEDRLDVLPHLNPLLPVRIPGGRFPGSITATDLNGDQNPELVVTNYQSILVLSRQNSDGFRQTGEVSLDLSPTDLLVSDLDGDGSPDLLVTAINTLAPHSDVGTFVILNRGDGTFHSPLKLLPEGGPVSPAVLDLDDDGDLDLAVANQIGRSLSLFRNQGEEGWSAAENLPLDLVPGSLHATDLNGDGRQDLVFMTGRPFRQVIARYGQGEAGLAEPRELYSQEGLFDLQPADLDGDGLDDLLLTMLEGDRAVVLQNLNGGGFAAPVEFPAPLGPVRIVAADLNADGYADLSMMTSRAGSLRTMLNSGSGTFSGSRDYYVGRLSGSPFTAGDLDGDGDLDLATTDAESVVLLDNLGEGGFAAPAIAREELVDPPGLLRRADLDGDGDVDLVMFQSGSGRRQYLSILLNDGHGAFTPGVEVPTPEQLAMVDLLDVNEDDRPDILVGQRSGFVGLVLYLNHGDATFDAPQNAVSTGHMSSFCFADFDGDSRADLALPIEFPVGIKILPNAGGGTFPSPVTLSWPQKTFSPPVFISAGDFTGDGLADVIVGPYDDLPARLYASRGDLKFASPATLEGIRYFQYSANADLDGDGDLDLVTALQTSLTVYRNEGGGRFAEPADFEIPPNPVALEVTDVDGDRAPDVLLALLGERPADYPEGELFIVINDGRGWFSRTLSLHPGYRPMGWVLADFDGDGGKDLAVMNEGRRSTLPGSLTLVNRLLTPPSSEDHDEDGNPDECQSPPFHRGDANADGDLDVSDGLCVLQFLFTGSRPLPCLESADSNNDGSIDCSDAIFTLGYLFLGSAPPADPGPPRFGLACGSDPDLLGAPGYLGCEGYRHCGADL